MSNTQEKQNRLYSENNRTAVANLVALIGSFLAVFVGFFYVLKDFPHRFDLLLFVSVGVYLVLDLLCIISVSNGYDRRRDHIIACLTEKDSIYANLYSNGLNKNIFSFLLDFYCIMAAFMWIAIILFTVLNIFFFSISFSGQLCGSVCMSYLVFYCVIATLAIFVPLVVLMRYYFKYKCLEQKVKDYSDKEKECQTSMPSTNIEITVNN